MSHISTVSPKIILEESLIVLGKLAIERANQQLVTLKDNILKRTSVVSADHVAIKIIIVEMESAYNCLDGTFATAEPLATLFDRAIELISFTCERLRILQDFIRSPRLQEASIDYAFVVQALEHDQAAMPLIINLMQSIIDAENNGASYD